MAKDFEMGYLLDFYGEVLTPKQREMLNQTSGSPVRAHGMPSSMARLP